MKKDVIYVDIEDDITSIIDKVKGSSAKIVALVPPKRIGVLQSAVNLKLMQRAALSVDKRVVMITNDHALASLAASVSMPVAKNLQSKPEIAPISTLEIDDIDVINGEELPVGELASTAPAAYAPPAQAPIATPANSSSTTPTKATAALLASKLPKKGPKVPNFDSFRKKLFIFGGAGLALIGFLVWAIVFAPRATVTITAQTTPYEVDRSLSLNPDITSDEETGALKAEIKETKKTETVDFPATGKKEVGEKAKGTVLLSNSDESDPVAVPAGSTFTTATGQQFTSDTAVTVPGFRRVSGQDRPGTATVAVTATDIGEEYNVGTQGLISNDVAIDAKFDQATSGGSSREVTVISDADVTKAREQLAKQNTNQIKTELREEFGDSVVVITESFASVPSDPVVAPAVGQESTSGKLTAETTYRLVGVEKEDLDKTLQANIIEQLEGIPNQKIYDSGINKVRFEDFKDGGNGQYTATVTATGFVGPNINTDALAKEIVGKRIGEIREKVQSYDGVQSVDAKLSPFWVTSAPSEDKITIKYLIENETN